MSAAAPALPASRPTAAARMPSSRKFLIFGVMAFGQFMATHPRGSIVNGSVREVDAKGATIDLGDGVEGYLRANDIAKERVDDATHHLKVGDKVEAKFTGMDRKGRVLQLSIRAKDDDEMQQALEEYQSTSGGTTKLGALLKEQMNKEE